jgi:hypothetical protein
MISEFFLLMEFANPMIRGDIGQMTQPIETSLTKQGSDGIQVE